MSYKEFYKFRGHPLATKLCNRTKRIIRFLTFWYSIDKYFALYKTQELLIDNLIPLEEKISSQKARIKEIKREATELAINSKPNITDQIKGRISTK